MYNMEISIFGYKLDLEILILIGIIYLILVSHTVCGTCDFYNLIEGMKPYYHYYNHKYLNRSEGFVNPLNDGESSKYSLNNENQVNTSSWFQPNLTVQPGKPLSAGVKEILNRKPQPIPLPKGELDMFATTPFKPECCPNTFSNSSGCACMTTGQYNYLIERGGNNVPYSEY